MAYRAFDEESFVLEMVAPPRTAVVDSFTPLEMSVISLAGADPVDSVRERSRLGRFVDRLFGLKRRNTLADPKLEALRRFTVLAQRGRALPPREIDLFIAAGFSPFQARALQYGTATVAAK